MDQLIANHEMGITLVMFVLPLVGMIKSEATDDDNIWVDVGGEGGHA